MPPTTLSEQDKIYKAQALEQKMELEKDLDRFTTSLDQLFRIAPPMKLNPTERGELDQLGQAIKQAAATNAARARILELLRKGLS